MKPSMIERMRAKQGLPPGPPPPKTPDVATAALKGMPPGPEKTAVRQAIKQSGAKIKFRCGHEKPLAVFMGQDCPECRGKIAKEKAQRNREKIAAKKASQNELVVHRLPEGATKTLIWRDGAWHGMLTVPGVEKAFEFQAGTERETYHGLHSLFVDWLKDQR